MAANPSRNRWPVRRGLETPRGSQSIAGRDVTALDRFGGLARQTMEAGPNVGGAGQVLLGCPDVGLMVIGDEGRRLGLGGRPGAAEERLGGGQVPALAMPLRHRQPGLTAGGQIASRWADSRIPRGRRVVLQVGRFRPSAFTLLSSIAVTRARPVGLIGSDHGGQADSATRRKGGGCGYPTSDASRAWSS